MKEPIELQDKQGNRVVGQVDRRRRTMRLPGTKDDYRIGEEGVLWLPTGTFGPGDPVTIEFEGNKPAYKCFDYCDCRCNNPECWCCHQAC